MSPKEVYLTPEGLEKLKAELDHLRTVRRQEVASRIQKAKELSSPVDNAEYEEAKNEQAFVEGRILQLEKMVKNASIIRAEEAASDTVVLGSRVTVRDQDDEERDYTIVGSAEASPTEGRISNESPVGRALLGKHKGETVVVHVPAGDFSYKILDIS